MPYLFTCPYCNSQTEVEDQYSGQSGECFSCNSPIQLPDFDQIQAQADTTAAKQVSQKTIFRFAIAGMLLIVLVAGTAAVIRYGGTGLSRINETRLRRTESTNLEKIADGLNAYYKKHKSYPPATTYDSTGQPLHSWRVLILPFIGQEVLYEQFNLKEPWDSATNLTAALAMPDVYRHPSIQSNAAMYEQTGFFLVTGPQTVFPHKGKLDLDTMSDLPSQTILVVATSPPKGATIGSWTEPEDYSFARMQGNINSSNGTEIGGLHSTGVSIATIDGRSHFLKNQTDPQILNALVTPNGNEQLRDDVLD